MDYLKFTLANALEILSDEHRRTLGDKARKDAETDNYDPPKLIENDNYWANVVKSHEQIFYTDVYSKRKARIERMKNGKIH